MAHHPHPFEPQARRRRRPHHRRVCCSSHRCCCCDCCDCCDCCCDCCDCTLLLCVPSSTSSKSPRPCALAHSDQHESGQRHIARKQGHSHSCRALCLAQLPAQQRQLLPAPRPRAAATCCHASLPQQYIEAYSSLVALAAKFCSFFFCGCSYTTVEQVYAANFILENDRSLQSFAVSSNLYA